MSKILIAYAGSPGDAHEIAQSVASELLRAGHTVVVMAAGRADDAWHYESDIRRAAVAEWAARIGAALTSPVQKLTGPRWQHVASQRQG